MPDIPLSSIDRIIRYTGATRIKPSATETLRNITENLALLIAKKSLELTHHRSQQTISDEDIKQAFRLIFDNLPYWNAKD